MSVSATIESIDGRLAGSNGSLSAALVPACAAPAPASPGATGAGAVCVFCFNRAQRRKTLLPSLTARLLHSMWKRLPIALALDEGTLDMMFGDKLPDDLGELGRHGHLIHQIVAGISERFAFRWISRPAQPFVRGPGSWRTHNDPQRRRARCEIVAIVGRLRAVEFDHGLARIEQGRFCFYTKRGPGGGRGTSDKRRDRLPQKIGPAAPGPAPLNDDAHHNARKSGRPQLTGSICRMGRPVIRFCG